MPSRLNRLYLQLPSPLRSLAASVQGYRLNRLRYGPETNSLVAEALRFERRPITDILSWQQERLTATLIRAATVVPYYRRFWSSDEARGRDYRRLEDWPILEKETIRTYPHELLATDLTADQLISQHTSGTTGKPLHVWWSRSATRRHYALCEARWRQWYGVSRDDRWAILGGRLVVRTETTRPPFWVWNSAMNQLYMSSYHLTPRYTAAYFDALKRYRVRYLYGYSSALYALAQDALATGRTDLKMTVAVTNAEPLLPHQRDAVSRAFACPVRETYGMTEIVAAAGECEAGRLHLWPESGVVEVLDGNRSLPAGEVGDLVCTGLINDAMSLVRYRLGDRGALDPDSAPCSCGRTLPRLKEIEGRSDDVLYTADGRRIGRLDTVFKTDWPIREAQIIQEDLHVVRVRFVPADGYSASFDAVMIDEIRNRMGDVDVRLEPIPAIERSGNGKFRAVVCNLPAALRTSLEAPYEPSGSRH